MFTAALYLSSCMHSRDDACAAEASIETAGWSGISKHCTAEMLVLWKLPSKLLKSGHCLSAVQSWYKMQSC